MSIVLWFFEFGYLIQHVATISQILRIRQKKNVELVSLETNLLFLLGSLARMVWMWDSMLRKFWLSYVELLIGIGSLIYIIFLYQKYKVNDYYNNEIKIPIFIKMYVLLPVIFILSFLFHPGKKGDYYFTMQMFVSLNVYSEAVGLLPQLYVIQHTKDTGNVSQWYAICLGLARFCRLLFWVKMYIDGNKFISLLIADFIHCLLLFNFIYSIIKNWNKAVLPTFGSGEDSKPKKMF